MAHVNGVEAGAGDDSAISITTGFVLHMGVATILIAMMLLLIHGPVTNVQDTSADQELAVTGERLVSELERADRMQRSGAEGEILFRHSGVRYLAEIEDNRTIRLESGRSSVVVRYAGHNDLPENVSFGSGHDLAIEYGPGGVEVVTR